MFFIIVFIRSFLDENQCCVPVAYCSSNFFLIPLLLLLASSENPIYCVCINKGAQQTTIADGLKGLKHNSFLGQSFFFWGGGGKPRSELRLGHTCAMNTVSCCILVVSKIFIVLQNGLACKAWNEKTWTISYKKTSITLKLFYRAGALWSSGYGVWHKFER